MAAIFGIFGGAPRKDAPGRYDAEFEDDVSPESEEFEELPYRLRDDFLSAAEFSFYRVLLMAAADRAIVCPKVNLADIFFVASGYRSQAYHNKIDRKHVDFLLCEPQTMRPLCGIELDDSSHARRDRQARDEFVDQVFEAAELQLVRIPARAAYAPQQLAAMLAPLIDESVGSPALAAPSATVAPVASPSPAAGGRNVPPVPTAQTPPICP
ncbi:MAG TPA: DUF2726 domain-containing protein, partial [Pirellulaceae bacterium]|nr:DUF2726 domain-containing protein [Pirellulaceae bacterium]